MRSAKSKGRSSPRLQFFGHLEAQPVKYRYFPADAERTGAIIT